MKPKRITKQRLAVFLKLTILGLRTSYNPDFRMLATELERSFRDSYGVELKDI